MIFQVFALISVRRFFCFPGVLCRDASENEVEEEVTREKHFVFHLLSLVVPYASLAWRVDAKHRPFFVLSCSEMF
jgi:hypothetical protein